MTSSALDDLSKIMKANNGKLNDIDYNRVVRGDKLLCMCGTERPRYQRFCAECRKAKCN